MNSKIVITLALGLAVSACAEGVLSSDKNASESMALSADSEIRADDEKGVTPNLRRIGTIDSGQTSIGELDGARYAYWTFDAAAGETVTLVAEGASDAGLDTVLFVYRTNADGAPTGRYLRYNDDFGGELSSRIEHEFDATGTYAAVVRRYDREREGAFALYLEVAGREVACGARLGNTCAADEFCDFSLNAICGWADATGVCNAQPRICTMQYLPVCGCDGQTYSNLCSANAAGTSASAEGPCESDRPGAGEQCTPSVECAEGLVCGGLSRGEVGECIAGDLAGEFYINTQTITIPDNDAAGVSSTIEVTGLATVPDEIWLDLDIVHTWRGDLRVTLTDPGGQIVTLHDREGGSADNLSIHGWVNGFSMDDMVNGDWTLHVYDLAGEDVGEIDAWGLRIISRYD